MAVQLTSEAGEPPAGQLLVLAFLASGKAESWVLVVVVGSGRWLARHDGQVKSRGTVA